MAEQAKTNSAKKFFAIGDKDEFEPENWTSSNQDWLPLPERDGETGVKVLIVGAGLAGLMAALECWRKGHEVVGILERNQGPNYSGEFDQPIAHSLISELNISRGSHHYSAVSS